MSQMALTIPDSPSPKGRASKGRNWHVRRVGEGFRVETDVSMTYALIERNPASIVRGLPIKLVHPLAEAIGMGAEDLAKRIGVSRSSFHRWSKKPNTALSAQSSDALVRFGILMTKAMGTFDGDGNAARQWLSSPQPGLGNAVPLDLAQTTPGFREVEKLLTRIDLGVYA
jgi:putative toxin-antitoxin system antitoxin component (TIGR02293 family)